MSSSGSRSESFSSSYALIRHIEEFAGVLEDSGYTFSPLLLDKLREAISDETLGRVDFYGIDGTGIAQACATIKIDWEEHEIVVTAGDSIPLPVDEEGVPILRRIRLVASHFMVYFSDHDLTPLVHTSYRVDLAQDREKLNTKYGWKWATPVVQAERKFEADDYESDYHPAVTLSLWFAQ